MGQASRFTQVPPSMQRLTEQAAATVRAHSPAIDAAHRATSATSGVDKVAMQIAQATKATALATVTFAG